MSDASSHHSRTHRRRIGSVLLLMALVFGLGGYLGARWAPWPVPASPDGVGSGAPDALPAPSPAAEGWPFRFLSRRLPPVLSVADWEERLAQARAQQRLGNYDEAAALYTEVAHGAQGSPTGAAALLGLGQVQFLSRRYEAASATLTRFRERYPTDDLRPVAMFWSARAAAAAERHDEALGFYREVIALRPDLEGYTHVSMVESLVALRDFAGAIAHLEAAEQTIAPAGPRRAVQVRLAEVLTYAGDYPAAARRYRDLLGQTASAAERASYQLRMADALRRSGDSNESQRLLLEVLARYPATSAAALALRALREQGGGDLSPWLEGVVAFHQRDNDRAEVALRRFLAQEPGSSEAPRAYSYLAALAQRRDEDDQALALYEQLARTFPTHPLAQDARWQRARLLETLDRLTEAAAGYRDLRLAFPLGPYAADAAFREGLVAYKLGDYQRAAILWHRITEERPAPAAQTRARFWLGKALLALGDRTEAARHLATAAALTPGDYYALRALDLLQGAATPPVPAPSGADLQRWSAAVPEEQQALREWLVGLLPQGAPDAAAARDVVRGDARVVRGLALLDLGLRDAAVAELRAAHEVFRQDPAALVQLAVLFQERDLHHLAAAAGWSLLDHSGQGLARAPRWLQRVLSPAPYAEVVVREAGAWGVDPLLLLALAKQESAFDTGAASSANARGLTQVIPPTGQGIARALGVSDWEPDDLYRPALSLRFGAFYLAEQVRRFNGDAVRALAAYNAGPGMALAWSARTPQDSDLFVEEITFAETSRYVRQVTAYYAQYRALYGTP